MYKILKPSVILGGWGRIRDYGIPIICKSSNKSFLTVVKKYESCSLYFNVFKYF